MTSTLATALAIVAVYHAISTSKKSTPLHFGLIVIFLVDIILFIGGQTSALTFTSVSDDCTHRNVILTFADQLARVSSFIVGLNIVDRVRIQWPKFVLYSWVLARLGDTCLML